MDRQTERQVIEVTCPDPECRQKFRMYRPEKAGVVKVGCPHCKKSFQLKCEAPSSSDHSADPEKTLTMEPTSDDVYKFMCPHCAAQAIGVPAKGRNLVKLGCPKCKGSVTLVVNRPAPQTELEEVAFGTDEFDGFGQEADAPKIKAILRVFTKRRFLPDLKTDFPIIKGSYFIGRADPDNQPDIPLNGDTTVSRKSVQIEVIDGGGYEDRLYPLTVIKATNPVTVNGKRLRAGESVFLNFDDRITMGKTELVFLSDEHNK